MAVATIYNSWGIPTARVEYESYQDRADKSAPSAAGVIMVLAVFAAFFFLVSSCLPLWQRVFLHPKIIRVHIARTWGATLAGLLLIALYALGGVLGMHHWGVGAFTSAGIFLLALGLATRLLGYLQLLISKARPEKCSGNGFGWLNMVCLFTPFRPWHLWTLLQDGAFIGVYAWMVRGASQHEKTTVVIVGGLLLLTVLGFTWYSQAKFADPTLVEMEGIPDETASGSLLAKTQA